MKPKSENRKAFPKFILIVFLSAIFGGVLGFFGGALSASNLPETLPGMIRDGLILISPFGIPVAAGIPLVIGFCLHGKAKKLVKNWDGEEEEPVEQAETALNWALLCSSLGLLVVFFFLAAVMAYDMLDTGLLVVGEAVVGLALVTFLQQKTVDLIKVMNPEKKGSVYDRKFNKLWFESCDEAEQKQIGQASYKTFRTTSMACLITWASSSCWASSLITACCPPSWCCSSGASSRSAIRWNVFGWGRSEGFSQAPGERPGVRSFPHRGGTGRQLGGRSPAFPEKPEEKRQGARGGQPITPWTPMIRGPSNTHTPF